MDLRALRGRLPRPEGVVSPPIFQSSARIFDTCEPGPSEYRITFTRSGVEMSDALWKRLVVARQPELEDYYWQVTGETDESNEMSLVGMMCDSIDVARGRSYR